MTDAEILVIYQKAYDQANECEQGFSYVLRAVFDAGREHGRGDTVAVRPRESAAAPATGAQAEDFLEVPDVQDESGLNTHYSRGLVLECIAAALAATQPTGSAA